MILEKADYITLAAILTRRAKRYTKKADKAQQKAMGPDLIRHLHQEANWSLMTASRILRGLEVEPNPNDAVRWVCPHCQTVNDIYVHTCIACYKVRSLFGQPDTTPGNSQFMSTAPAAQENSQQGVDPELAAASVDLLRRAEDALAEEGAHQGADANSCVNTWCYLPRDHVGDCDELPF